MKLRNLFKNNSKGGFSSYNLSGDGSSMTMSEYEEPKEEYDRNVQNDKETEKLPNPSRIELDIQYLRKIQAEALEKEIKTTGLHFRRGYDDNFLIDLLKYMKDNYDEAILFYDEIIKIKKEEHFPYLNYAVFGDGSSALDKYNGNILREKYNNFFEMLDLVSDDIQDEKEIDVYVCSKKCNFWNNLDCYLTLMLYIFEKVNNYSDEMRNEFLDKAIDNFQMIKELKFDNIFIKLNDAHGDHITLDGQPRGILTRASAFTILYYKEENFYTDGKFEDKCNSDEQCVDIVIQRPSFIIKNRRKVFRSAIDLQNYDKKYFDITVYNLDFDSSKLPSYEEIQDTECHLDSYLTLMYDKKCEVFKKKLVKLAGLFNDLYSQLDDLTDLAEELEIQDLLKEIINDDFTDLFSDEDLLMLDIANDEKVRGKVKVLLKQLVQQERK